MKFSLWLCLVLLCASCTDERSGGFMLYDQQEAEETNPQRILQRAHHVKKYVVKTGQDNLKTDVFVVVGKERFPYERLGRDGYFNAEVCKTIMENPSSEIQCLCAPEYADVYVLKDQWHTTCGAIALSRNHNSLTVFNAGGKIVSNHHFQTVIPNQKKSATS